jgi:uncharacterized protein
MTSKLSKGLSLHPKILIYFGGNGERVSDSVSSLERCAPHHTLYLLYYRGYGQSTGSPSESGILNDAEALYQHVAGQHEKVSVMGRSLGTGVATYLAVQHELEKLILITPYDSIRSIAQEKFPVFPMSVLLSDSYDSLSHVPDIQEETLVIRATHDQVVTPEHTQNLIDAFAPVQLKVVEIASGHNDLNYDPNYTSALLGFLNPASQP